MFRLLPPGSRPTATRSAFATKFLWFLCHCCNEAAFCSLDYLSNIFLRNLLGGAHGQGYQLNVPTSPAKTVAGPSAPRPSKWAFSNPFPHHNSASIVVAPSDIFHFAKKLEHCFLQLQCFDTKHADNSAALRDLLPLISSIVIELLFSLLFWCLMSTVGIEDLGP